MLASPSYRQADRDPDFLGRDETRGVRLQLDYMKAELLLQRHGVEHTIVVFGGTRILGPAAARRKAAGLARKLASDPRNSELRRMLAAARRVIAKSRYYVMAREFGRIIGRLGQGQADGRIMLMIGGGAAGPVGARGGAAGALRSAGSRSRCGLGARSRVKG